MGPVYVNVFRVSHPNTVPEKASLKSHWKWGNITKEYTNKNCHNSQVSTRVGWSGGGGGIMLNGIWSNSKAEVCMTSAFYSAAFWNLTLH